MTEGGALSFQYNSDKLQNLKYPSYSVLRSKFDKWMAEKAEEAGVMLLEGFRVDRSSSMKTARRRASSAATKNSTPTSSYWPTA